MRIRIINRPIAPPWDSGSMNMAYWLAVSLSEVKHKVFIPTLKSFHPSTTNLIDEPIYTSRRPGLRQKARLIKHLLTAQPVDILHFFLGLTFLTATLLSSIAKYRHQMCVLTLTHIPKPGAQPIDFGQRVVTYSAYLAQLLQQSGVERVVHIPPGVDEQVNHPGLYKDKTGHLLGIPSDVRVVLYGGEYGHSTILETLFRAISICVADLPETHFVLACRI